MTGLRLAARTLLRRPVFMMATVGSLAIGIGAATVIYTVVDGVLVQPPPYRFADQLVSVWPIGVPGFGSGIDRSRGLVSYPLFRDLQDATPSLEQLAAYGDEAMLLALDGGTRKIRDGTATANLFEVLGVDPLMGRASDPKKTVSLRGESPF